MYNVHCTLATRSIENKIIIIYWPKTFNFHFNVKMQNYEPWCSKYTYLIHFCKSISVFCLNEWKWTNVWCYLRNEDDRESKCKSKFNCNLLSDSVTTLSAIRKWPFDLFLIVLVLLVSFSHIDSYWYTLIVVDYNVHSHLLLK